ncbi:hypothetical protein COS31_05420 [Candidatus Roizmanbacteria bacterium CG02_land_8_20_14_3_00_36_15]|nr:MAG: hypothetical protein COS31_05420 [Candidatus Roizmanbacteria bacterium CG02_land_8_20_14_3_00_36_15]
MKSNFWLEVDIVELLGLDQTMTPVEVDEFTNQFNKELWFRFLNEKIKSNLKPDEWKDVNRRFPADAGLDPIVDFLAKRLSAELVNNLLAETTKELKKDFTRTFLMDILTGEKEKECSQEKKISQQNLLNKIKDCLSIIDGKGEIKNLKPLINETNRLLLTLRK